MKRRSQHAALPQYRCGPILTISLAILIMTTSFEAKTQDHFVPEDLSNSINADYIYICSGSDRINADRVRLFVNNVFLGVEHPEIIDGPVQNVQEGSYNIIFYVDDEILDDESLSCLSEFMFFQEDIIEIVQSAAEIIGTLPPYIGSRELRPYHSPVHTVGSYRLNGSWLFISYISSVETPYLVNGGLTRLFGLDQEACLMNTACDVLR